MPLSSSSLLSSLRRLPSVPGVYIFKDAGQKILYVGKSKNIKNRVKSYFRPPVKLGAKTALLVSRIRSIDHISVYSETEALLLESRLIRKFKPFFNLISRDDKSPFYIHLTSETFPKPVINHDPVKALAGPFLNRKIPFNILKHFRRVSPFCLAPRPVRRPCIYSHIGLCHPCPADINSPSLNLEYRQNISRLTRLLKGDFAAVKSRLAGQMKKYALAREYEKAAQIRERLRSLEYTLSAPLNPDEFIFNPNLTQDIALESVNSLLKILQSYFPNLVNLDRIEAYDISHLGGTFAAASMVVALSGSLSSSSYRHFKIRLKHADNDPLMLAEAIRRRLGNPWPLPDLIVLDGGKPQLSAVTPLTQIPVISLAKSHETVYLLHHHQFLEINIPRDQSALKILQILRDEAHRFTQRLHHRLRRSIIES